MLIRKLVMVAMCAVSARALAQNGPCPQGPGVAAGIRGYSCSNCEYHVANGRTLVVFNAEPVVTEIAPESGPMYIVDGQRVPNGAIVNVGDVVVSVNGQPITTRAGAEEFAYPTKEWLTLVVRRAKENHTVEVGIQARCRVINAVDGVFNRVRDITDGLPPGAGRARGGFGQGGGNGDGTAGGNGQARIGRGARVGGGGRLGELAARGFGQAFREMTGDSVVSRFGFAVECRPSCKMRRSADGVFDFTYDGYPEIVSVRPGSVAEKTGLKVGDLIVKAEGRSIFEDGALQRAARQDQMRMTVRRDGKDIDVNMVATKS